MEIWELLDSAYLGINKNQVYVNGRKIEGRFKYNEIISLFSADLEVFKDILKVYPQKTYKVSGGHKLTYTSRKASEILRKFLPNLKRNKERAEIILKLTKDKSLSKTHAPFERMKRREAIKKELEKQVKE